MSRWLPFECSNSELNMVDRPYGAKNFYDLIVLILLDLIFKKVI